MLTPGTLSPRRRSGARRGTADRARRSVAENVARAVAVAVHLGDEVVDGVETLLAAEVLDELHRGLLAVEVAVEVEQVRLEERVLLVVVEGRAAAE